MWRQALITPETTIMKAVEVIDQAALQIALVVDREKHLLGTVTDGDVRRGLLKGIPMSASVVTIMNTSPAFVHEGGEKEKAALLMKTRRVRQIPVLNSSGQVVGLEIVDVLLSRPVRDNQVVLMAGGLGMRLRPLTQNCPKPLLKVGNKPVLETILEGFIDQGFTVFYISVNYLAHQIMEYFGDGSRWKVTISYLRENDYLGTAGALALLPDLPQGPLIVMNGDILTRVNFGQLMDFHAKSGAAATMCVKEHLNQVPYGVATVENDRLLNLEEKPEQRLFINAGVYVINPEVLTLIPRGSRLGMTDLLQKLLESGQKVAVFPIREYWIDIGRLSDFVRANDEFGQVFG